MVSARSTPRPTRSAPPGDLICAAPQEAFSLANLPNTLNTLAGGAGQPMHAMYATTQFWNVDGAAGDRVDVELGARTAIDNAPHPKHG